VAGFARAGSALRRHVQLYLAAVEPTRGDEAARKRRFEISARRLVSSQLAFLKEGEARLAAYVPSAPEQESINYVVPGALAGVLVLVAALVVWHRRRRWRRLAGA